jgi:heme/copper-type cytochrome/quinol oxidase subunit 2
MPTKRKTAYSLMLWINQLSPLTAVVTAFGGQLLIQQQSHTKGLLSVSNMLWPYFLFISWIVINAFAMGFIAHRATSNLEESHNSAKRALWIGASGLAIMLVLVYVLIIADAPPPQAIGLPA